MGAFIATLIFIIYTAASGLFGVVYTDVVQFFMLLIFVYLLIPTSSINFLGGLGEFWQGLDKQYITPYINGEILGDIRTGFLASRGQGRRLREITAICSAVGASSRNRNTIRSP